MAASRNLRVANPVESKAMLLDALGNEPGLPLEIVALNAGAALYVAGVADSIADGLVRARDAVGSGMATAKMRGFVEPSPLTAAPHQRHRPRAHETRHSYPT